MEVLCSVFIRVPTVALDNQCHVLLTQLSIEGEHDMVLVHDGLRTVKLGVVNVITSPIDTIHESQDIRRNVCLLENSRES